jgi:tetratricopeptide (TPR) repeat protein
MRYFQEALDVSKSTFGSSHLLVGKIYGNFAIMHQYRREYDKAIEYYRMSLDIKESNLDEILSTDYAITLYNIAGCFYNSQNFESAVPYAEKALNLWERNLSPNHELINIAKELLRDIKTALEGDTA